jgi:hypothetical protein
MKRSDLPPQPPLLDLPTAQASCFLRKLGKSNRSSLTYQRSVGFRSSTNPAWYRRRRSIIALNRVLLRATLPPHLLTMPGHLGARLALFFARRVTSWAASAIQSWPAPRSPRRNKVRSTFRHLSASIVCYRLRGLSNAAELSVPEHRSQATFRKCSRSFRSETAQVDKGGNGTGIANAPAGGGSLGLNRSQYFSAFARKPCARLPRPRD